MLRKFVDNYFDGAIHRGDEKLNKRVRSFETIETCSLCTSAQFMDQMREKRFRWKWKIINENAPGFFFHTCQWISHENVSFKIERLFRRYRVCRAVDSTREIWIADFQRLLSLTEFYVVVSLRGSRAAFPIYNYFQRLGSRNIPRFSILSASANNNQPRIGKIRAKVRICWLQI